MNNIFILEDDKSRIDWFLSNFAHCNLTIASDIDEAKAKFLPPYELTFLDHDLGGKTDVSSEEYNTGYQFAKFIIEKFKDDVKGNDIVVHSLNSTGAENIVSLLRNIFGNGNIFYIPFWELMSMWKNNQISICGKKRSDI